MKIYFRDTFFIFFTVTTYARTCILWNQDFYIHTERGNSNWEMAQLSWLVKRINTRMSVYLVQYHEINFLSLDLPFAFDSYNTEAVRIQSAVSNFLIQ